MGTAESVLMESRRLLAKEPYGTKSDDRKETAESSALGKAKPLYTREQYDTKSDKSSAPGNGKTLHAKEPVQNDLRAHLYTTIVILMLVTTIPIMLYIRHYDLSLQFKKNRELQQELYHAKNETFVCNLERNRIKQIVSEWTRFDAEEKNRSIILKKLFIDDFFLPLCTCSFSP